MRKLLYITFANSLLYTGGSQCSKRNLNALQSILGEENVLPYIIKPSTEKRNLKNKIIRLFGIVKLYMGGLNDCDFNKIKEIICKQDFTDIFIDNSQLGQIAKWAKKEKPYMRIYTFFHNIEHDFCKSVTFSDKDYKHFFWIPLVKWNEKCACKYSDKIIVLNGKDALRLKTLYNRHTDHIIPITMKDDYFDKAKEEIITAEGKRCEVLFVGSYFPGNINGLMWFCENVIPYIDIHLTIVGAGMEKLSMELNDKDKISIYSNVPNITPYYEHADIIALPIKSGGGMKVKTAEALKYGKFIIGTPESLEGYDINDNIAIICNTAKDFIEAFRNLKFYRKYSIKSRELFKKKYSNDVSVNLFRKLLIL